jgi:hypothetical protein
MNRRDGEEIRQRPTAIGGGGVRWGPCLFERLDDCHIGAGGNPLLHGFEVCDGGAVIVVQRSHLQVRQFEEQHVERALRRQRPLWVMQLHRHITNVLAIGEIKQTAARPFARFLTVKQVSRLPAAQRQRTNTFTSLHQ